MTLRSNLWKTLILLGAAWLVPALGLAIQPTEDANSLAGQTAFIAPELHVAPSLEIHALGASEARGLAGLEGFFARYSDQWEVRWDLRNERPHLLQGVGIPLLPGRGNDLTREELGLAGKIELADVEARLRDFLAAYPELLRVSDLDLRLDPSRSLAYGDGGYLWVVELQQYHEGVPVEGANVFFRINHGNIVQLGADRIAEIDLDPTPAVAAREAFTSAFAAVGAQAPLAQVLDAGTLKVYPAMETNEVEGERYLGEPGHGYRHLLVWEFTFKLEGSDHTYKLVVDAHNGQVLEYLDLTVFATVQANVYPTTNTDPLVTVGLPFANVSNGGTVVTDASGNYTYSGGTATSTLNGRYIRMSDACGAISLSNSTTGNLDFGGAGGTDCTTPGFGGAGNTHSSRSGFYHLTRINRKAATFFPTNTWLNGTLTANMNINQTCNAFWDGSTVNFYRSGGGCSNTGEIAAVFLHEWGHGMDTNSGGAANENGSGEAVGDTFAFLETRDACIGKNFLPGSPCANCNASCTGVRDVAAFATGGISTIARPSNVAVNTGINCDRFACPYVQIIFPYQGPMGYEGHCESYIASSANWDLAQQLIAAHGTNPGWSTMDDIWYGSLTPSKSAYRLASGGKCNPNAAVDGCAATNWYTVYLPADDDDGNLANGTPNACRIWSAFNAHGIACGSQPACSGGGGGPTTVTFTSVAAEDGWVLESSETSNTGGSLNATNSGTASLRSGDATSDRQYKTIVSFDTSSIPDGATVLSATLRLRRGTVSGTTPFNTHGTCQADIVSGAFSGNNALQNADFQAAATATNVATLSNATSNGALSEGTLNAAGLAAVNKSGRTQLRIYFTTDDNDDNGNDYIGWYSANNGTASNRPVLEVTYQ